MSGDTSFASHVSLEDLGTQTFVRRVHTLHTLPSLEWPVHSDKEVRNTGLVHSSDGGIWNGCDARRKEDRYSLSRVFLGYERRHKRGVQQAISPSYPASCPYAPSVTHFVPSVVTRGTQRRRGGTIIRTGNG